MPERLIEFGGQISSEEIDLIIQLRRLNVPDAIAVAQFIAALLEQRGLAKDHHRRIMHHPIH